MSETKKPDEAPPQGQPKEKTSAEIRSEYSRILISLGDVQHKIFMAEQDVGILNNALRTLDLEYVRAVEREKAEAEKAKAEPPKTEEVKTDATT